MNAQSRLCRLVVLVATTFLMGAGRAGAQGWYDVHWLHRRPVTVANPGATALSDHQVRITLDNSFDFANARADGADVRLTSSDGTTPVPFWIESWNAGALQATLWAKVPALPVAGTALELYYGNAAATGAGSGASTFEFFDDFESWVGQPTAWTDEPAMPSATADQTSAVSGGRMYTFGGYGNGPGDPQSRNYEFDPGTNAWTEKAPMPTARWGMAAAELGGRIYVFGGSVASGAGDISRNEAYDPVANTWTVMADIPSDLARQGVMAVTFGNRIHLFYESSHYEYDPVSDTYTPRAAVPSPRFWCTSAVVGAKIYLIGGHHAGVATNDNQEYTPATDSWATKAPLPVSLWGATRDNPVINGKIYVTHGLDGSAFHTSNYAYDPATNTWEQKGSAAHARDGVGCGVIANKLYVVGGRADFGGPFGLAFHEVYDPLLDTGPPQGGPSQWSTSGTSYVFADAAAKHQGNYGLVVQQAADAAVQRYAQSLAGFGASYALDYDWQITDVGGIGSQPKPQGLLTLTETDAAGTLFFYNASGVPVLRWYTGSAFNHLQNSTWNSWHKITVVRNGAQSRVAFDGTPYSPPTITSPAAGGTGRFKLGVYFATRQYVDDVRVRKWAGADPVTTVGAEEGPPPADLVAAEPGVGACISSAHACVEIPVTFTRSNPAGVRGYSARVRLSPELAACGAGFVKGPYLSAAGATTFQVVDHHDGSYDVDEAILGSCNGGATGNGTLFTLHVGSAAAGGTGTITIESVRVRDCANADLPGDPGAVASVGIDNAAPAAPTALSAQRVTSGNDLDGTEQITLAFGANVEAGGHVEVWRKGFGNYPEYDDGASPGAVPTLPAGYPPAGWTPTAVSASGQVDEPASRDAWYYVAYAVDACGNAAASALSAPSLNYALGDVHNGSSDCTGDNRVTLADVSFLGAHYGASLGEPDALACLDVGPTTSGAVDARPQTDDAIDFEDLVLFAINYGTVTGPNGAGGIARATHPAGTSGLAEALALELGPVPGVGGTFEAVLRFSGTGAVQALSAKLDYDRAVVEPVGVSRGALLAQQAGPAELFTPAPGTVDVAAFGAGQGLAGAGELARVTFRVKTPGAPGITLGRVQARDARNRPVALGQDSAAPQSPPPGRVEMATGYPNPFRHATTVILGMPSAGRAKLVVFDIQGRAVRHLLDGAVDAGWRRVTWDGRDDAGNAVSPGSYVVRLATDGRVVTKAVRLIR